MSVLTGLKRISATVHQKMKRDAVQYQLVAAAGGCCARCQSNYHPNVYDFHHRNPSVKEFNLDKSNFTRSYEKLKREAEKCVLLCANCHREVHTFMDQRFLDVPGPFNFEPEE